MNHYTAPTTTPFDNPRLASKYLRAHKAGWESFFTGMQVTLTDTGYRCGPLPWRVNHRGSPGAQADDAGMEDGFAAAQELLLQNVVQVGRDHPPRVGEWQSPIGERSKLDRDRGVRRNEHYYLVLVTRPLEPLDGKTHAALERKLRDYCQQIGHEHFTGEFGPPTPDRVKVGIRSEWEVPEEYIRLLARVVREERVPVGMEIRYE